MKTLRSHLAGGPETLALDDVADPIAGPGEVIIAVRACGINFLDTLIIRDLYQMKPPRPFAPGVEVAGIIAALGAGVTGWSLGQRVIGLPEVGGMAEAVAVDQARVFAAVQLGKALGLRVIGAVSSEEKAEAVREAGAEDVVIYPRGDLDRDAARALASAFKAATAKVSGASDGANIVYDCIGGPFAEPAIRSLAWGGRYLTIGFAAGIPSIPLNLTLLKSIDIRGVFYGAFTVRDPARNAALCSELLELAAAGKVAAGEPTAYPLARGGEAIASLASRQSIGKVVVEP